MSEWKQKRFWDSASAVADGDQWAVALDGRVLKTPAKAPMLVPTQKLADAIATEWDAQEDVINPLVMPFTRAANAAIDKVAHQRAEVADMLAAYGDADLLCYRAESPSALVERQKSVWDPILNWSDTDLGAPLYTRTGVIHAPQSDASLKSLSDQTHQLGHFELAAFHDLVAMSGSLILGFAVLKRHLDPEQAWDVSRVDENWQEEQWGEDEEATAQANVKKEAFLQAFRFYELLTA